VTVTVVTDDGSVTVTDAALAQIVAGAAEAVDGARVKRKRSLEIEIGDTGTRVEVGLSVAYGRVLPDVARDVQRGVAAALGTMCGMNVHAVDVTVEELH
jgi:uncharacterized alkaline shock family protein YloU